MRIELASEEWFDKTRDVVWVCLAALGTLVNKPTHSNSPTTPPNFDCRADPPSPPKSQHQCQLDHSSLEKSHGEGCTSYVGARIGMVVVLALGLPPCYSLCHSATLTGTGLVLGTNVAREMGISASRTGDGSRPAKK